MQGIHFLVEKHCEICDKLFYPGPLWAYKTYDTEYKTKWYCSWKCLQAGRQKYKQNKAKQWRIKR